MLRVVLVSDVAPVRELVEPGVNGLVGNPFDTDGLVETALRVLDDPAAYRPLAEAGRRCIEERYSLEVCHPELKEYFERMATGGARPGQKTEPSCQPAPSVPTSPRSEQPAGESVRVMPREKFNVCLICWPGPIPYFEGYREVAETVQFGLRRLGYEAVLSEDLARHDHVNIIFGGHMIREEALAQLPARTIFYNLEQVPANLTDLKVHLRGGFPVWDYSLRNLAALRRLGATRALHVPIGYVPEMNRIQPAVPQDVDVLFYGGLAPRRTKIIEALRAAGMKVEALEGVYGAMRDRSIARAKVVLNLHALPTAIFEIVRVSYLLGCTLEGMSRRR